MKQVRCLYCGFFCSRYGKTHTGRQRWYCKECHSIFVNPINNMIHDFKHFIQWLFGKAVQKSMPGDFEGKYLSFGKSGLCRLKLRVRWMAYMWMVFMPL